MLSHPIPHRSSLVHVIPPYTPQVITGTCYPTLYPKGYPTLYPTGYPTLYPTGHHWYMLSHPISQRLSHPISHRLSHPIPHGSMLHHPALTPFNASITRNFLTVLRMYSMITSGKRHNGILQIELFSITTNNDGNKLNMT